jgi:hypothetical protein
MKDNTVFLLDKLLNKNYSINIVNIKAILLSGLLVITKLKRT